MNGREKKQVATLILCGGKSSRFGTDKALLLWEGLPLLRKMALLGLECSEAVYLLTPHPQAYRSILPQGCHFLAESQPHQGPLVAFAQGLSQIEAEWIFLLACDLPLLTPAVVQGWLTQLPKERMALVPFGDGYWHPLCGFYRGECLTSLRHFLAQGGKSFQAWLDPSWVEVLAVSDPRVLFNCNTPSDWHAISDEVDVD